jgi:hypothetical protein
MHPPCRLNRRSNSSTEICIIRLLLFEKTTPKIFSIAMCLGRPLSRKQSSPYHSQGLSPTPSSTPMTNPMKTELAGARSADLPATLWTSGKLGGSRARSPHVSLSRDRLTRNAANARPNKVNFTLLTAVHFRPTKNKRAVSARDF